MYNTLTCSGPFDIKHFYRSSLSFSYCYSTGLSVKEFLGFSSLQEVECSGESLTEDIFLTTLILYRKDDGRVLVRLRTHNYKTTCETYLDYSSCNVDQFESRKSAVRALIADLSMGERVDVGCNASGTLSASGLPELYSWLVPVYHRRSKSISISRTSSGILNIIMLI